MDTCLYIICVSVLCCERKTLFLDIEAYAHTHTNTHTEQYQTGYICSIWHLYLTLSGILLSGLLQIGQMQLSWSPLSNRKCTTVDREPVWRPCLDEVVHHEGLIECHLRVHKSPPSVKLATDSHSSPVNTEMYSVSILFYAGYNTDVITAEL